tara:strand:+ start:763 stop:1077 length:315 start_codon:yes stop_codon:yes gene_type:complete
MSNSPEKLMQDLILFYVRENYNNYLRDHGLKKIPEDKLDTIVNSIYLDRKEHLKKFVITSLKKIMKDEYVGDLVINNLLIDIFRDDDLCINRIKLEIKEYQKTL